MKTLAEYKSFLTKAALICLGGLLIMGLFTITLVWAQSSTTPASYPETYNKAYNTAGSFGITGMAPLTIKVNEGANGTPAFIAKPLKQNRGVILLVYVKGAADDQEMLASFEKVKAKYAAQASFFNFEAHTVGELGDVLSQLQISAPPALAVISGDGSVYQMYTGWIDEKVMEQVVANAVRS
jgi:hypothetical protein